MNDDVLLNLGSVAHSNCDAMGPPRRTNATEGQKRRLRAAAASLASLRSVELKQQIDIPRSLLRARPKNVRSIDDSEELPDFHASGGKPGRRTRRVLSPSVFNLQYVVGLVT